MNFPTDCFMILDELVANLSNYYFLSKLCTYFKTKATLLAFKLLQVTLAAHQIASSCRNSCQWDFMLSERADIFCKLTFDKQLLQSRSALFSYFFSQGQIFLSPLTTERGLESATHLCCELENLENKYVKYRLPFQCAAAST